MMAKSGFFSRLARGWATGLIELDKWMWGGTIACAACTGLIVHAHGAANTSLPRSRQQSALQVEPACANPTGSALAGLGGRRGWVTTGLGTPMTAKPGYDRHNRMVFPYTSLVVLKDLGGSLEVVADVGKGQTAHGYISADRVQYKNPAADAVAEDSWLKVTAPGGSQMRYGPDLNAGGYGVIAPVGTVLHEIAAIRESRSSLNRFKDFFLVDQPGTEHCQSPAWVARWQVEETAAP
jgi:hypothetical protein